MTVVIMTSFRKNTLTPWQPTNSQGSFSQLLQCFSDTTITITLKKSRIRETKHLSTDVDSTTDAIGGWTKAKSAKKKLFLRGNFRPLPFKNVQMLDHFFPLLFPKDSESLKILDIRLWEVGAKKPLKKTENQRRPKKSEEKNFLLRGNFRQFLN